MARQQQHPCESGRAGFFQGKIRVPGIPPTFSRTPASIRRLQPRLGEHSVEVLREVGLDPAEIERLLSQGATVDGR